MFIKRPYSKEASRYQKTNSLLGFSLPTAQTGLSVSFVDGKVLVTDPKTGQTRTFTETEWRSIAANSNKSKRRAIEAGAVPKDETGAASLGKRVSPFIAIVNANGIQDDIFDVYLDGKKVLRADFSDDEVSVYLILFPETKINDVKFYLERAFYDVVYRGEFQIDKPKTVKPGGLTTVFLKNVFNNDNGNFGKVVFGILGQNWVNVDEPSFIPDGGEDYTITLDWPPVFDIIN